MRSSKTKPSCNVVWITGLSGSGKSSLANELAKLFRRQKRPVILLDGDDLRYVFDGKAEQNNIYAKEQRVRLALQYSKLCEVVAKENVLVIVATISLFDEIHKRNRSRINGYVEVFLDIPVSELEKRDPKGLYSRFRAGEITNVAGLDLEVDFPTDADFVVNSQNCGVEATARELFCWIKSNYYLQHYG